MATHTYLDVNIVNNNISDGTNFPDNTPIPIVFNTRRNADYLTNPNDYYVSVIRWSMDCRLPIIVPQILLGQHTNPSGENYNALAGKFTDAEGDYWNTTYVFAVEWWNGGGSPLPNQIVYNRLKFRPQTAIETTKDAVFNLSEVYDDPYFYVTSIDWFIYLLNQSLIELAALITLAPSAATLEWYFQNNGDGGLTFLNNKNGLFYYQKQGTNVFTEKYSLIFNGSLNTLLNGFSTFLRDLSSDFNYELLFTKPVQTTTIAGVVWNYVLTEYPVVPFWSPISSIVFTTQGIPVEPTNSNPTNTTGNPTALGAINENINLASIITDFDLPLNNGTEGRQIVYYTPSSEYRMFDLNTNRPLSTINIIANWKDKLTGSLHQMYLFSGGGAALKILFRKRDFFSQV